MISIYSIDRDELFSAIRFSQKKHKLRCRAGEAVIREFLVDAELARKLRFVYSITKAIAIIVEHNQAAKEQST